MRQNNPILTAALTVFGFWWLFFTLREFSLSPLEVIRNWAYIGYSMRLWVLGAIGGVGAAAWYIWYQRAKIEDTLKGTKSGGMVCTLGAVPRPASAPERVANEKKRLPVTRPIVAAWLAQAKEEHPDHAALFLAIWDIYSQHREWPASHRMGGHANRRLWEHCLAVTETALTDAPFWKFEGVFLQQSGRKPKLIIAPSRANFEFDASDPLIPVLALAHDIGKLECYKMNADGSVRTTESGSTRDHDDVGISHDALGARILARLPEFWKLPPSDRRILSLVIAHYHHPSHFPVDRNGLSLDDRMTSLLEYLIRADKKTGMQESGLTEKDVANAFTEDESKELYDTFVEIVTEHGRINGIHGNAKLDKDFMIGSKHGDLIVVKERPLRTLLHAKMGLHLGDGDERYRLTRNLLHILTEKGLLYTKHNGSDFAHYFPMWQVSLRRTKDGGHICDWGPVLIFRPLPTTRELDILVTLAEKRAKMRIEAPRYTHNNNIRDPEALRDLVRRAFDENVARQFTIPRPNELVPEDEEVADPAGAPTGAQAPVTPAPAPTPAPAVSVPADAGTAPVAPIAQPAPASAAAAPAALAVPPAPALVDAVASPAVPVEAAPAAPAASTPPWEEPGAPANLPVEELDAADVDLADVPDVHEGDDVDEVDLPSIDNGDVQESADDLFDDFPSAAAPAPAAPEVAHAAEQHVGAEPVLGVSPRDTLVLAKLRQDQSLNGAMPVPAAVIPPDVVGRTIRDADAPRSHDIGKGQKAKDAMKALAAAAATPVALEPMARKKKKPAREKVTVALLQQQLASRKLIAAGEHDGHAYVFHSDLISVLGPSAFIEAAALGLPQRDAGKGVTFIGIPIVS